MGIMVQLPPLRKRVPVGGVKIRYEYHEMTNPYACTLSTILIGRYKCFDRLHPCHKEKRLVIDMLVVQFRIADLYHPSAMLSFLMLVYSPIRELDDSVPASSYQLAINGEPDPISESSTRQVPIMPPRYP